MHDLIIRSIILTIVGLGFFGAGTYWIGYSIGKKEKIRNEEYVWEKRGGLLLAGIFFIGSLILLSYLDGRRGEARRRLNEPVVSMEQLYGYVVLDKKYIEKKLSIDSPETKECFIKIKDVLATGFQLARGYVIENVRVSEEVYEKVKKGEYFPPYQVKRKTEAKQENEPNVPR